MPERPRELIRTALREPFTPRARRELLFCAIGALYSQIALALIGLMLYPGTAFTLIRAIPIVCAVFALGVVTGLARKFGNAFRGLAARLPGNMFRRRSRCQRAAVRRFRSMPGSLMA